MTNRTTSSAMALLLRNSGRALLTAADVGTIIGPFAADWNDSHIFKPALAVPRALSRHRGPGHSRRAVGVRRVAPVGSLARL